MKKIVSLLLIVCFMSCVAVADTSYISTEAILNRCFDSDNNALKADIEAWTQGNVVYVGIDDDIETAVDNATAGDTLLLASGTYTITNTLTVDKKLHIKGMGKGITTIACSTANIDMLNNTGTGTLVSDLTLTTTQVNTTAVFMIESAGNIDIENVEFINTASGSRSMTTIKLTSAVTVNVHNCNAVISGAAEYHLFVDNQNGATVNIRNCKVVGSNGTSATLGNWMVYCSGSSTINMYDCYIEDSTDIATGVVRVSSGTVNIYGSTINGSGATAYDVQQSSSGTLTLYDCTLKNGTTSGTITYGGTVVSEDGYFSDDVTVGDDLSVTGDINGTAFSTAQQHHEIGVYLDVLTSPVAIVGLTGTMADASTETGYESGSGRTWTYNNTTTADKITEGNTYVIDMDGTDDYMSTPDTDDMSFDDSGANPFSMGAWVEVVADTGVQTILAKWDETSGSELREYTFIIMETEKLRLYFCDESANVLPFRESDAAVSEGWHFVVASYDSTGGATAMDGVTFYVDGVAVASTATNDGSYVGMENTVTIPTVAAYKQTGGTQGNFWTGDMGRLFVTPEELTAAKVWQMYERDRGFYNK